MERATDLHAHLAQRILAHLRSASLPPGHHLTEQSLQQMLGVSRGPIRAALTQLERHGVVERRPHRGFFVAAADNSAVLPDHADEVLYRRIAAERLAGVLPAIVSETELGRRYDISRHRLGRVLDRIAAEGWIEKRRGHGWAFLALINSPAAYQECYQLRVMLEPAAMRLPTFRPDAAAIDALEREQASVRDTGYATLSQVELFETNSRFHESLAGMSGNRFVHQVIVRQNQLRRLVEYRRPHDPERVRRVCREHLAILALIRQRRVEAAADALAAHLKAASREKTAAADFITLAEA
jgi:DNA-binding GntR family transcriptional regulator